MPLHAREGLPSRRTTERTEEFLTGISAPKAGRSEVLHSLQTRRRSAISRSSRARTI